MKFEQKTAQRFQWRSRLKMLTDGRTDGRKVITIAHPEQSSGELKILSRWWLHGCNLGFPV